MEPTLEDWIEALNRAAEDVLEKNRTRVQEGLHEKGHVG